MKVQINEKREEIRIQLTAAQVKLLRDRLHCHDKPVQYAGGVMYAQGSGWYLIFGVAQEFDWAPEFKMAKALMRKIREILQESKPTLTLVHEPEQRIVFNSDVQGAYADAIAAKPETPSIDRLAHLAQVVNSKYHR